MTFGPTLSAAATYARRYLAASCVITRQSGEPTFNATTGTYTYPTPTTVYSGACQVVPTGRDRVVEFGEAPTPTRSYDITLNGLSETIQVGDLVTVSSTADPRLNTLELRVMDVQKSSLPTNRRLVAEEVIA